jgi:hypothetical protein
VAEPVLLLLLPPLLLLLLLLSIDPAGRCAGKAACTAGGVPASS